MAVRAFTVLIPVAANGSTPYGARIVKWTGLLNGDTGAPYVSPQATKTSVHVYGTPGATPHLLIQGTNEQTYDPTPTALAAPDYQTLHDAQGVALDLTAAGIKEIMENTTGIRPNVTGGDGTTTWTVVLCEMSTGRL